MFSCFFCEGGGGGGGLNDSVPLLQYISPYSTEHVCMCDMYACMCNGTHSHACKHNDKYK